MLELVRNASSDNPRKDRPSIVHQAGRPLAKRSSRVPVYSTRLAGSAIRSLRRRGYVDGLRYTNLIISYGTVS
jgi:hypothetical protein